MGDLRIVGIPGSLRAKAFSTGLLLAAQEVAPPDTRVELADIRGFPVFNQDEEKNVPDPVRRVKEQVRAADAVLFAVNEHNYGLSAAEKNVLDWVSRPYGDNSWNGKPAGILSASVGQIGGARAQYELRQSMVFLNLFPINRPEVIVPFATQKFDAEGRLTDPTARKFIGEHLVELARFARQLGRPA
ncbi:MAG TPA: NAD(P)H-dependent oxidoreductase [Thermoplasmata archaeon]|nr:NAD(P)H-dependent oxidoreductase [Thermoplasmata archaeon]